MTAMSLLLPVLVALAQDEKPRLPLNPFADAVAGDWLAYSSKQEGKVSAGEWKIEKVEGDVVTLSEREGNEPVMRTLSKKEMPTLDAFSGIDEAAHPEKKVVVSDDEREVGGRKFKCKKLLIPLHDYDMHLWISPDVRLGLVAIVLRVAENPPVGEWSVIGFGRAGKTEWGMTAAQFNSMPKELKLTDCGKAFGLEIYEADGWKPEEINDQVSWSKEGYLGGMCVRLIKKWMDGKMNDRKGLETEDDIKDYCETHSGKVDKLESKTKTDKGWYVITQRKGSDDKPHSELMYVMKFGGETFLFIADLTKAGEDEGETITLAEALKIAETIKARGK